VVLVLKKLEKQAITHRLYPWETLYQRLPMENKGSGPYWDLLRNFLGE
jgi:hypothetical protein